MKQVIAFLMAVSLSLTLAACGSTPAQSSSPAVPSSESTSMPASSEPAAPTPEPTDPEREQAEQNASALLASITAETAEASGPCGEDVTWYFQDGTLAIKGSGPMEDYFQSEDVQLSRPWDTIPVDQIHSFLVEPGVTSIGNYACFALTHLEEVFLPDSVFHIGENAFGFCPMLQSIYIPDSVRALNDETFLDSSGLTSVRLPDKLESIGEWCFKGCQSLTDCVLPEHLTTIGLNAFSFCESLSSVSIPKSVTLIDAGAFSACYSLDAFHIDSENPTYTAIDGIIFSKDGLTLVEWPAGRGGTYTVPDGVTAIGDSAFLNTDGLTSVTLPASLTSVGSSVFLYCADLQEIHVPASVNQNCFIDTSGSPASIVVY